MFRPKLFLESLHLLRPQSVPWVSVFWSTWAWVASAWNPRLYTVYIYYWLDSNTYTVLYYTRSIYIYCKWCIYTYIYYWLVVEPCLCICVLCIYIYIYPCTTWIIHVYITGWCLSRPSEKWWSSSVGMMTFPIYGKIKNVPNHQPDYYVYSCLYVDIT
jgi:hypothetical protein